uniref:Malonyl-CoA decarboxylase n=1 Tax=Timema cristinae TaxID=61476 RepID=A0A7R9GS22_TIMCR|nr:unnamed protein product [Timema cristinae]
MDLEEGKYWSSPRTVTYSCPTLEVLTSPPQVWRTLVQLKVVLTKILGRDFNNSVTNKGKHLISRAALRMDGNGSPNRRMGLCQRLSPVRYLITGDSPIDEMGQTGRHGGDSADYYFGSNEDETPHRPSTVEDEVHVKNLLREILTYRESNVSNWIIESKVKRLSTAYKCLLKPHKEGFLKELSRNHAVDHHQVQATARTLIGLEDSLDERQVLKVEGRLKMHLTPQYSWLFIHLGRLERGVKFLVDMRTDVLELISELDSKDPHLLPLQQLNFTLRETLSLWFSVGFLNLERVTWRSPCEMLQKISEYEAVHPVRNWTDLKRRVGPYRRCFVYTHSSMPDEPLVVLHTALSDDIVGSMSGIVSAASRMSGRILALRPRIAVATFLAAIFYSISSTQKGLQGIELGNYLIKRVVRELQAEFPLVNQFFNALTHTNIQTLPGEMELLTSNELDQLRLFLSPDNLWSELRKMLHTNSWVGEAGLMSALEGPLMRLCARYLYLEKRRGYTLDSVANFHLRNGAVMWRLNWRADLTPRGLGNSCGIMVNYRYFLDQLESNSRRYQEEQYVTVSEQVLRLAAASIGEQAQKVTSKL